MERLNILNKLLENERIQHLKDILNKRLSSKIVIFLSAFLIYLVFSLWLWGFPVSELSKKVLGNGQDPLSYIWFLDWIKYALIHGVTPFETNKILSPVGVNIAWSGANGITPAILFFPITLFWGPLVSYNLLVVLSPVLNSFFAFVLCLYVTKKTIPSLIGGYIFGFSSYVIGQMYAHLTLYMVFLIPLIVLTCLMFYQDKINKFLFVIILGFLLALQFNILIETFATMTFFGLISLLVIFLIDKGNRKRTLRLGLYVIFSYIFAAVILSPSLYYIVIGSPLTPKVFNSTSYYSSDLLNFIIPTHVTWLGGNLFSFISTKFTGNLSEEGTYVGIPMFFLLLMYFKEFWNTATAKILFVIFLVILISSFGPYLHILGHILFPVPWLIIDKLPLIKHALPTRFPMFFFLPLSIIVSIWLTNSDTNMYVKYIFVFLCVIFLLPNTTIFLSQKLHQNPDIPPFISQKLYKKYIEPNSNVLIIPYSYPGPSGYGVLWQVESYFYFNMLNTPFPSVPLKKWPWQTSIIISSLEQDKPEMITCAELLHGFISLNKINYIILSLSEHPKWESLLDSILNIKPQFVGGIYLYKVPDNIIEKYRDSDFYHTTVKCNLETFTALYSSSEIFIKDGNAIIDLFPQYLEKHAYLDKLFRYKTGPAYNWTQNGGWIGQWPCPHSESKCFGVGIIGYIDELKPIIEKYRSQSLQIFFPYPREYNPNISPDTNGELLMIFQAPKPSKDTLSIPYTMDSK